MKTSRILLPLIVLLTAVIVAGCAPKAGQIPTAALPAGKAWAEGKGDLLRPHRGLRCRCRREADQHDEIAGALRARRWPRCPPTCWRRSTCSPTGWPARGRSASSRMYSPHPPGTGWLHPAPQPEYGDLGGSGQGAASSSRWPKSWPLRTPGKSPSSSRASSSTCRSSSGTAGSAEPWNRSFLPSSPV